MITNHKTILVKVGEKKAMIDEGIADLIRACWEAGIKTWESCQGDGRMFLSLPPEDALKFLTAVVRHAPESRVAKIINSPRSASAEEAWHFRYLAVVGPTKAMLDLMIEFPQSDYEFVLCAICDLNTVRPEPGKGE